MVKKVNNRPQVGRSLDAGAWPPREKRLATPALLFTAHSHLSKLPTGDERVRTLDLRIPNATRCRRAKHPRQFHFRRHFVSPADPRSESWRAMPNIGVGDDAYHEVPT